MEYRPGIPEHNDNVSHQRPVREFFQLAIAAVGLVLITVWLLGSAVDWAVEQVDPRTEEALLAQITQSLPREQQTDSAQYKYVAALLQPLAKCVQQPYQLELVIVEDEAPNAFAVPGGQMWLTTGLLDSGLTENGLAFVMGHELGHFAHRDHLRGLGRGLVVWVLSSTLLGADSGLSRLLSPSLVLGEAQHSQARESASDETGLAVLQCHYGHVGGATDFFQALQQTDSQRLPGLHYFESHPQLQARIDALHGRAELQGLSSADTVALPW